jgi:hypothetical protein
MGDALRVALGGEWVGLNSEKGSAMGRPWLSQVLLGSKSRLRINDHHGYSYTSGRAGLG